MGVASGKRRKGILSNTSQRASASLPGVRGTDAEEVLRQPWVPA